MLVNTCIEVNWAMRHFLGLSNYLPQKPPIVISEGEKHKQRSLESSFSSEMTAPIRFSCVHAHRVNRMVDVATTSARRENQLALSSRKLISSSRYLDEVECACRSWSSIAFPETSYIILYYITIISIIIFLLWDVIWWSTVNILNLLMHKANK